MPTKIKWVPVSNVYNTPENDKLGVVFYPPEPLLKSIIDSRVGNEFMRCPAVLSLVKNTYVLRSPYDLTIHIDAQNNSIRIEEFDQEFFNNHIVAHPTPAGNLHVVGIPPRYVFVADTDEPVNMQLLPLMFHKPHGLGAIVGEFDISRWVRPIEFAFEVYDPSKPIAIKRGDPLCCVRFDTDVVLEQGIVDDVIVKGVMSCMHVKNVVPNQKLDALYELGNSFVRTLKKTIFKTERK